MDQDHHHGGSSAFPLAAIALLVALYIVGAAAGVPAAIFSRSAHEGHESAGDEKGTAHPAASHDGAAHAQKPQADHDHPAEHDESHGAHDEKIVPPAIGWVTPFVLLLLAIAVMPLLPHVEHWWESNLHRFYVAAGLGVITLLYYGLLHEHAIEAHWPTHGRVEPTAAAIQWQFVWTVFANAILYEFVPFIVLLFSLYTISGGIRIEGDLAAHPVTNTGFIAVGGLMASFIGTTGAAMLLIRPLLETNQERRHVRHTVIFFIFVVCNCGGCLLPIGDPPLFLGYLRGVPFTWTFNLWAPWLFVNGLLLAVYYVWDHFYCYPHETPRDIARDETQTRRLRFQGLGINGLLLLGVILSVALLDPSKIIPGTEWHPWMYLREMTMLSLVGLSLLLGSESVRQANRFNYHAILEVAALFCGIFICMQPALQILNVAGPDLGVDTPMEFFWATGTLSSVLDNAPTYVVFFETARTIPASDANMIQLTTAPAIAEHFLVAISLGAVFMGAMTYIGNGPNFMVKAIAEKSGIRMPSFFGFMGYSCAVLLPILLITTVLFLWIL